MTQDPTALLPGHGSSYRPPALAPTRTQEARAPYVPRALACLTVRRDGRVFLNAEAARLLPPEARTAELLHPVRERDCWHLSCLPGGRCPLRPVARTGGKWFSAPLPAAALLANLASATESIRLLLCPVGNGQYQLRRLTCNN